MVYNWGGQKPPFFYYGVFMSYALYRKGHTHWVKNASGDDVMCEVKRVELSELDEYRAAGWVDNVEDIGKEQKKATRQAK